MPRLEIPRSSSVYPDDVSPVESSEGVQRTHKSSPDVSPITDPQSAHAEHNSQIDTTKRGQVLGGAGTLFSRKTRPSALNPTDRSLPSTNLTRWDDFSGERTASEKGKPASTSPGAVRLDVEAKYGRRQDSLYVHRGVFPFPSVQSSKLWIVFLEQLEDISSRDML